MSTDDTTAPAPKPAPRPATPAPAVEGTEVAQAPAEAASAPPQAQPDPVPEDAAAASLNHKFLEWTHAHIYGGPIARNTDCWNALSAAWPALRASLLKGD